MSSDLIDCFCQVTGADEQTAISFLSACNENLDNAVSLFLDDPNSVPSVERYRTPIPQRTEQLVPMDLPTLSGTSISFPLRGRRRAFVADDSDEDESPVSSSVIESERIADLSGAATSVPYSSNSSRSVHPDYPASPRNSPTPTTILPACANQNGLRESKSKKRDHLRQLYQPPTELLFQGTFAAAQAEARERKRWLLVSLHDEECFDCHLLNRDVWKDPRIYQLIKKNFIFLQVPVDSPEGLSFQSRHSYVSSASHIAILDPFTSEQKVMWMHLKDPQSVHAVLTEFLKRSKLDRSEKWSVSDADHDIQGSLSTSSHFSSSQPPKRARFDHYSVSDGAGLSSRVAAVSSQISEESYPSSAAIFSCAPCGTETSSVAHPNLLDLTEEEQLRLVIEASKTEDHIRNVPNAASSNSVPSTDHALSTDHLDDLVVITGDDNDGEETISSDTSESPDCFIFDPDAVSDSGLSTTASITSRRPLRPPGLITTTTTSADTSATTTTNKSANHFTLPIPSSGEDTVELVVRLPAGHRQVLCLPFTLTLKDLRRHFTSCGFPEDQYELVRLYPRINLSLLPEQMLLRDTGLAKKDTIFLQDRCS